MAFAWLYGDSPINGTCNTCTIPIHPTAKRRFWDAVEGLYVNTPAEECDVCATDRRKAEAGSPSTSPSGLSWNLWAGI